MNLILWLFLLKHTTMQVCPPGLHIMLGSSLHLLEALCCQLDLELARQTTDFHSSSTVRHCRGFQCSKQTLNTQHPQEVLPQGSNLCSLSSWREKPSSCGSAKTICWRKKKKSVKVLACHDPTQFHIGSTAVEVAKFTALVKRGYSEKEGPFVKALDTALQSFGVQRQQYFGGAFIGNHVHKALKVNCAMHVPMNNSHWKTFLRYPTFRLFAHQYHNWQKRNCPSDLQRLLVKCPTSSLHSPYMEDVTIYVMGTSLMTHKHTH